ncbi:transaldolase [Candidatus Ferrigenium straubiae]|uniref:transaldolase n=1 Tax=Candidatus Ferrigenium straubiae TaxID=2919506 RepID=UPI003F4AE8BE
MKASPLTQLENLGQSVWLDYIRRDLIRSGGLHRLIEDDGLRGMTSNPSIFEKAILESHDYDPDIEKLAMGGRTPAEIYDAMSIKDVKDAADEFRDVYENSSGEWGYVSLEVNPHLAHDTNATIEEARRLWDKLFRPNVFIKVPATDAGLPAIRQLISEGINVNITLLFGLPRYRQVIEAYLSGIEDRLSHGEPVENIASVASFFVSRMDTLVDPLLEKIIAAGGEKAELAAKLHGQVAVANSKLAYQICKEAFTGERFRKLASRGVRVQTLLWASTSTKRHDYSDVKYVDELIGPNTINTVPVSTLDAYRDHGHPEVRIEQDVAGAQWVLDKLPELGIDMKQVAQQLEDEGYQKFCEPYDHLIETMAKRLPQYPESE